MKWLYQCNSDPKKTDHNLNCYCGVTLRPVQVEYLLAAEVREVATTLMITPRFGLANVEAFDILAQTITEPLELLGLEEDVQLVFFHPQHTFRYAPLLQHMQQQLLATDT